MTPHPRITRKNWPKIQAERQAELEKWQEEQKIRDIQIEKDNQIIGEQLYSLTNLGELYEKWLSGIADTHKEECWYTDLEICENTHRFLYWLKHEQS